MPMRVWLRKIGLILAFAAAMFTASCELFNTPSEIVIDGNTYGVSELLVFLHGGFDGVFAVQVLLVGEGLSYDTSADDFVPGGSGTYVTLDLMSSSNGLAAGSYEYAASPSVGEHAGGEVVEGFDVTTSTEEASYVFADTSAVNVAVDGDLYTIEFSGVATNQDTLAEAEFSFSYHGEITGSVVL